MRSKMRAPNYNVDTLGRGCTASGALSSEQQIGGLDWRLRLDMVRAAFGAQLWPKQ